MKLTGTAQVAKKRRTFLSYRRNCRPAASLSPAMALGGAGRVDTRVDGYEPPVSDDSCATPSVNLMVTPDGAGSRGGASDAAGTLLDADMNWPLGGIGSRTCGNAS